MRKRIVKQQEIQEIDVKAYRGSSERSPYQDFLSRKNINLEGFHPQAAALGDPDLLPENIEPVSDELEAILAVLNEGGLQVLSKQEREAFQLVVVEGLSEREAAKKMSCSRGTLQVYITRGSKKLRKLCRPKL